jgi:hypothetical protein
MSRQKRKHAVALQKMTGNRLRIQELPLIIRPTLHPLIIPKTASQTAPPRGMDLPRNRRGMHYEE